MSQIAIFHAAGDYEASGALVDPTYSLLCQLRYMLILVFLDKHSKHVYQKVVQLLDRVTDELGEDENHPPASLW